MKIFSKIKNTYRLIGGTIVLLPFALSACQTMSGNTERNQQMISGGLLSGTNIVANDDQKGVIAVPVKIVANPDTPVLLQGSVANQLAVMSLQDRIEMNQAFEHTRIYQSHTWRNVQNRNEFTLTPTKTFRAKGAIACREFELRATINSHAKQMFGRACRNAQGQWLIN